MKKSSRFWWLHGVILVAAAVGCRSNSCCTGGSCGGPGSGMPHSGTSGMTGSATSTMYQQGTSNYPGMSSGAASRMPAGQSYTSSGGGYQAPSMSSGLGAPH